MQEISTKMVNYHNYPKYHDGQSCANRPRGYKTFFMLDSAEHEICPANKSQITNNCKFFFAQHS